MGRGWCELGILWSSIVRELRNKKDLEKKQKFGARRERIEDFGTGVSVDI